MAQLRAAADSTGSKGLLEKLPTCDFSGDLSPGGSVPASRYRVTVVYRNANDAVMSCPPMDTPSTAALTATGAGRATGGVTVGAEGSRTISATYQFSSDNTNILGGAIRIAKSGGPSLCMDAGPAASPTPGRKVEMLTCQTGASRQRFAYTKDQNIRLVDSVTVAGPTGMCLDGGMPLTSGANVAFQPCGSRLPQQRWMLDGVTDFYSTSNGLTRGAPCFDVVAPYLVLGACGSGQGRVLTLDISVGAGMAGADTGQLVNFKQFSRCVDITSGKPETATFEIGWYCHQAPDGNFAWNQKWSIPAPVPPAVSATGRIRAVRPADLTGHCLFSPGTPAAATYVITKPCDATGPLAGGLTWTVYADTGDYTTSYRIVDEYGYCFTFTDLDVPKPDKSGAVAKTKVAVCDSTPLQKWNADPNLNRPTPLIDIGEN